jgi:hypothetical protein
MIDGKLCSEFEAIAVLSGDMSLTLLPVNGTVPDDIGKEGVGNTDSGLGVDWDGIPLVILAPTLC